jgi:hypothetical protein
LQQHVLDTKKTRLFTACSQQNGSYKGKGSKYVPDAIGFDSQQLHGRFSPKKNGSKQDSDQDFPLVIHPITSISHLFRL